MARELDNVPRCARCGYDRTGLPREVPAPACPECGGREVDAGWRGYWRPIYDATLPIAAIGLASWVLIGFLPRGPGFLVHVLTLMVIAPACIHFASRAGRRHSATPRGYPGRPGGNRIALVCLGVNLAVGGLLCVVAPGMYPGMSLV